MDSRAKLAAGAGGLAGVGILAALLTRTPTPAPVPSATPSPVATTALGFAKRSTLTAIAAVSSPLVLTKFEPIPQSGTPAGIGNIGIAAQTLIAQKAYGFDVWSIAPSPTFRFAVKSPYPRQGDGQFTVPRVAISQDGKRILAAQVSSGHATLVYDGAFQLHGEMGSAWNSATGVLEVDGSGGRYVAYSISASGAFRADVTTLLPANAIYTATRLSGVPVNPSMPAGSGLASGALWYSTGSAVVRLDLTTQAVTIYDSIALGLPTSSQLRGVCARGDQLLVEATAIDGISRGVSLLRISGATLTPLILWAPPAELAGFVGAGAIGANGIPYVWTRSSSTGAVTLWEDWRASTTMSGLDPKQTLVSDQAIYVTDANGSWWSTLGFEPSGTATPTVAPTIPPQPTQTPRPLATFTPTARPTSVPASTPTALAWSALCRPDAFTACLYGASIKVWIDGQTAELNRADTASSTWGLPGDPGEILVSVDVTNWLAAYSGPGESRATRVIVGGREISRPRSWTGL